MPSRADLAGGVFWLVLGLVVMGWAATFPFGRAGQPGPALLPVLCGAVLAALGAAVIVSTWRGRGGAAVERTAPGRVEAMRILWTLVGVAGAALLLQRLGFTATVFLLVSFLLRVVAGRRWTSALIYAVATAIACAVLFRLVLGVELPRGWLGI